MEGLSPTQQTPSHGSLTSHDMQPTPFFAYLARNCMQGAFPGTFRLPPRSSHTAEPGTGEQPFAEPGSSHSQNQAADSYLKLEVTSSNPSHQICPEVPEGPSFKGCWYLQCAENEGKTVLYRTSPPSQGGLCGGETKPLCEEFQHLCISLAARERGIPDSPGSGILHTREISFSNGQSQPFSLSRIHPPPTPSPVQFHATCQARSSSPQHTLPHPQQNHPLPTLGLARIHATPLIITFHPACSSSTYHTLPHPPNKTTPSTHSQPCSVSVTGLSDVFVSLSVRAIHLELVSDLTTEMLS